MKLPLGLGLLGLLVIGGGAFIGWGYDQTSQASEGIIVTGKGDAKASARARSRRADIASLRRHVRRVTDRALPHLPSHVRVQILGTGELSHAPQKI